MRFLLSVILIILLSALAEYFLPWWSVAVVAFLVSAFIAQKPGKAFLAGFSGIAIFWLLACLVKDMANDHILSTRMAALFHLPNYGLFIVVTVFIGGLVGGLAAWSGALLRPKT